MSDVLQRTLSLPVTRMRLGLGDWTGSLQVAARASLLACHAGLLKLPPHAARVTPQACGRYVYTELLAVSLGGVSRTCVGRLIFSEGRWNANANGKIF